MPSVGPKNRFLPFQPNHQVNPENRPFKDSKIAAISEFAIIGQSPPFLDWSISVRKLSNKLNYSNLKNKVMIKRL